ncbi:MAG: DUF4162 domain-containing protein, partial [Candidatus Promineifilaceae bacterium]
TTGLDPASRRDLWDEVKRLNRQFGITIFLTTQYLEEADQLSDVVAIINRGKIATMGSPTELKAGIGLEAINVSFADRETAEKARESLGGFTDQVQIDRDTVRLYMGQAAEFVPAVVSHLQQAEMSPNSLTLTQPTLDDVFLQVTGRSLQPQEQAL